MYIETSLTDSQRSALQDIFRSVGDWTQPHVAAQRLGLKRVEAIALLDSFVKDYPRRFTRKYLVYHICSEAPVTSIPDNATIQRGWICPQCEEEVELDGINLDFIYTVIAPVDFLNPDDGLVRYWRVDYFPYYVRGFSPNTEPALVLKQRDAEIFDAVMARRAESRQESFMLIEREFEGIVRAIVRDLPR